MGIIVDMVAFSAMGLILFFSLGLEWATLINGVAAIVAAIASLGGAF